MAPKGTRFCDMTLREIVEALVRGELPDGRKIDAKTIRASLGTALPMLKRGHDADRAVVIEIGDSPGFEDFLGAFARDARLIERCEAVCREALNCADKMKS